MKTRIKLLLSEQLVMDALRNHSAGTFSETAHVNCRWVTLFLSLHPFFPRFHLWIVYLSLFAHLLSHLTSPLLFSTIHIIFCFFLCSLCINHSFPYASSWESAVALITVWLARSHIWQPLAGKSPVQTPPSPPPPFTELTGSRSFVGFYASWKNKTNKEPKHCWSLSFISELSRGYTCSCSRAFQHYTAGQHLSINQLINYKYNDLPLNLLTTGIS